MSTVAQLWPLVVGLAFAYVAWDLGKRTIANRTEAENAVSKRYAELLATHQETSRKALNELIKQMREETDSMHAEVKACVAWVRTKTGLKDTGELEAWQQRSLEDRQQKRKLAQRSM